MHHELSEFSFCVRLDTCFHPSGYALPSPAHITNQPACVLNEKDEKGYMIDLETSPQWEPFTYEVPQISFHVTGHMLLLTLPSLKPVISLFHRAVSCASHTRRMSGRKRGRHGDQLVRGPPPCGSKRCRDQARCLSSRR